MYGKTSVISSYQVARLVSVRCSSNASKKLLEFLVNMPKANSGRIADAQRQRQHILKKSEKYGPSTVYLQVLGSGARGAPNTLYLFTDQKRYLFNCGESTQRLAHEYKVKLSRLEHIFITNKSWCNIGGLPGLSLTLQDVGVPNLTLHGPEGLDELYNATKRFVIMKDMNVTMAKCSPSEDFSDSVMTVKYVLLGPHDNILMGKEKPAAKKPKLEAAIDKEFEEFSHDETDYYRPEVRHIETSTSGNRYVKDKTKQKVIPDKDPMKKKTEKVLHELQKKTHCSVAYICTLKKRLGTLDLAKCVERGVKPGPMLGQLKNGHDVVLPDGTLVLSKDVKTPDDPGPVFIVLDVPELSYLKEAEFSAHFDNSVNPIENIPSLIVHLSPPHVLHHPTYRTFMGMFGPRTRHLVLNAQNSCLGSEAVHRTQHKLHLLDADIFPLLRDASVPAVWNAHPPVPKTNSPVRLKGLEELKNKIALAQFQNIINMEGPCKGDGHAASGEEDPQGKLDTIAGRTLTMFHLRPKRQLDRSAEPKLHIQEYIEETMDVDGFVGSLEQFRRLVDSMRYAKSDSQREYPKVVFLGTGSCIPSKTRNTSAIVLQIDEKSSMLMDCGEGTFGQLVRFYGPKKVNGFLRTLKAIYISHLHADHHIGLIGVLQARRQALEEGSEPPAPLHLLAPGQIATWLTIYDQQFERIRPDFTLVPNQSLLQEPVSQYPDMTSAVLASLGVQQLRTCYVSHCPNAFGLAVQIDDHHKLTYSGDTIPCEELIKIGENSTLLIHEATMEDELWEEARTKMHSTTSQAIEAGRAMRARYTLLTHFSQRYARLPRLNAHILSDNNSVGIAFDNMQITMSDLELLPHMYAPLQLMFAEHCVEMEMKAAQRAKHKERTASPAVQTEPNKLLGYAKSCNSRKSTSPSARASSSAATPHAKYRESNASRLRQEIKGMTITGSLRKPRSKSSSPIKKSAASTPRSEASDVAVRGRADRSPESLDLIATPRTMSETSDISRADTLSTKVSTNPSAGYIVDTHSKTINSVGHSPTGEEVLDIMANAKKRSTFGSAPSARAAFNERNYKAPERPVNSYGKPLVTHLNKKLIIRRDNSNTPAERVSALPKEANNIPTPARYPIKSWRAETSKILPETTQKHDISRTKLPTKGTVSGNKLRGSNTSPNVKPDSKIPVKTPPTNKTLRASTTAIPKTTTNKSPTRPVKTSPVEQKSDKPALSYNGLKRIKNDYQRDAKSWSADTHHSPTRPIPTMKLPYNGVKRPTYDPTKKSSAPLREIINDKLRQPFAKEMPVACVPGVGRQSSTIHSNRSFKPQLEDIKSSYLLLNNKSVNRNVEGVTNNGKGKKPTSLPVITKPEPVNENARREQLNDIKKKFQSRRFWNDSKYDKIEGLNWISWK